MAQDEACLMAVREDTARPAGREGGDRLRPRATRWSIRPKRRSVETDYGDRARDAGAGRAAERRLRGLRWSAARWSTRSGCPDASFFIFYDDVDFALRARRAGYRIWAVRDAVLVRQLDFDQQHDLAGWKGFYMYRNLFAVHFRYGENPLVRAKPYADRAPPSSRSARCAAAGPRRAT